MVMCFVGEEIGKEGGRERCEQKDEGKTRVSVQFYLIIADSFLIVVVCC